MSGAAIARLGRPRHASAPSSSRLGERRGCERAISFFFFFYVEVWNGGRCAGEWVDGKRQGYGLGLAHMARSTQVWRSKRPGLYYVGNWTVPSQTLAVSRLARIAECE